MFMWIVTACGIAVNVLAAALLLLWSIADPGRMHSDIRVHNAKIQEKCEKAALRLPMDEKLFCEPKRRVSLEIAPPLSSRKCAVVSSSGA